MAESIERIETAVHWGFLGFWVVVWLGLLLSVAARHMAN